MPSFKKKKESVHIGVWVSVCLYVCVVWCVFDMCVVYARYLVCVLVTFLLL